ncbi:2-oxoglutarate dehydrogenase E1 component [Alphaproteobacteria bacterium]|jgi:2-oxoglutarate dehydrogenase E1 component|nr:2-oxoglutarate dehydrogenase E1 component [Alphaproteobacteria bacterium]
MAAPNEESNPEHEFLSGANAVYIAQLQQKWRQNPLSVDQEWSRWFEQLDHLATETAQGKATDAAERRPSWGLNGSAVINAASQTDEDSHHPSTATSSVDIRAATMDSIKAIMLIRAFRIRGHLQASLDPLNLVEKTYHPELDPETYGFTDADMDRPIFINYVLGLEVATLRQILDIVRETYCGTIGVEFMHIQNPEQKSWIQERMEAIRNHTEFTSLGKKTIYERLVSAENFEQFLHKKYVGTKRFGMDGAEAIVPALEQILKRGTQLDLKEVVIGMSHRGRLNVLHNVLSKPFRAIISEFLGNPAHPEDVGGSGDVKYHMGASSDRGFDDNEVHLTLNANPSHLEIVNPVVVGRTRAKQKQRQDTDGTKVMGLLIHGDAAFAGQGIVSETFAFSALRGYRTGGTMHIIVNNQIGFTTDPAYSRSSPYPTDVAKMVMSPIFHVNSDDVEAVVHVARIATEFRQKFKTDVVIDMICYRRFGHNEGDEPMFTQPKMYQKIAAHPSVRKMYADKLAAEGVMSAEETQQIVDDHWAHLEAEFEAGTSYKPNKADWLEGKWAGLRAAHGDDRRGATSVSKDVIDNVARAMTTIPDGLTINSKLKRVIEARKTAIASGANIDWSTAEHLAFGTLLVEGNIVRLSGQDSCRGTFSQRHAVFVDQETNERYTPLHHISPDQSTFEVIDSPLSEASVLGFDYGFSQAEPKALVMWEAQFGDFANGAQVIVDQFISSGEAKWLRMSGLVMLLPHGHEGQGPEHSSARLERYLQLCAEDNMQVVNCSTPANYFHVLRRQMRRDFRKPLIIMTPKSLLRHKACVSKIDDFLEGSSFHRVIEESDASISTSPKRIVLCSGKVYYDLIDERQKRGITDVAIVRVEQLYPFPKGPLKRVFEAAPDAQIVWCQEEPMNMGSWDYIDPRLEKLLVSMGTSKHTRPIYVGRNAAASPATGSLSRHLKEQQKLVNDALDLNAEGVRFVAE